MGGYFHSIQCLCYFAVGVACCDKNLICSICTGRPQDLNRLIDNGSHEALPGPSHEAVEITSLSEDDDDHLSPVSVGRDDKSSDKGSPASKKPRFEDKENVPPSYNSGHTGEAFGTLALSTQAPLANIWKPSALAQSGSSSSVPAGITELVYNQQLIEAQRNRQILEAMRHSSTGDLVKQLMEIASKK